VHDELGRFGLWRPVGSTREDGDLRSSVLQGRRERLRGASRPHDGGGRGLDSVEHGRIGGIAVNEPIVDEERVHRPGTPGKVLHLVAELDHPLLVGDGHVGARVAPGGQTCHSVRQRAGLDLERHVRPVEGAGREAGVLHARRERFGHRLAEQRDELRGAADHR
jgi:hypothetical protein